MTFADRLEEAEVITVLPPQRAEFLGEAAIVSDVPALSGRENVSFLEAGIDPVADWLLGAAVALDFLQQ